MQRARRLGFGLAGAIAALAVVASSAFGSVTLGSALATEPDGTTTCSNAVTLRGCLAVNNSVPGANLIAPSDGVIVRWRVRLGDGTLAQQIRIRTVRRVDADQFTPISTGDLEDVPAGAGTYTFPTRLPINRGEQVGLEAGNGTGIEWRAPLVGAQSFEYNPSPADGTDTNAPTFVNTNQEHTFNVDVEPDADQDGYGDETQDRCPTDASTQGPCPDTEAPSVEITKGAPNKLDKSKVKFKFVSDDPTATFECKLKGKGVKPKLKQFSECASPRKYKRLDEGKHKFQVRATDPAGNVGAPAKDKFKVV